MILNSSKQQVANYVGNAKPEKAIEVIESWALQEGDNDAKKAITMIKADWNNLRNEENIGVLDNDTLRQRNAIINNRLLEFLWTKDTTNSISNMVEQKSLSSIFDIFRKKKVISFLTADPKNKNPIGALEQKQKIEDIIEGYFEFEDYLNTKFNEIGKHIVDKDIIHITVHGKQGELFFVHDTVAGEDNPVDTEYLCRQFKKVNQVKDLVMLIACNSEAIAEALFSQDLAKFTIGTTVPISSKAAIDFSTKFYTLLKDSFDIATAFNDACYELNKDKLRAKNENNEFYDYSQVFKLFH